MIRRVFEKLLRLRDRFAISLFAFPQGWRFLIAMLWSLGVLFIVGNIFGLLDLLHLSAPFEFGTLIMMSLLMVSSIKRSYEFEHKTSHQPNEKGK